MAFLAVDPVVIQLLGAAAPVAADIFKLCKEMYSQYKESKPSKAAASGKNPPSEQLVHIKQEISELKGMMKDPSKSTLQCQEKISDVDKKLDDMTLEASELNGMVRYDLSELKGMMKDSTKSTLQCQEMINKLDNKLEEMMLEATGLKGIVEDLASSTMTGFERLDHAFSQV
jgi:chromosome segregation ATPase